MARRPAPDPPGGLVVRPDLLAPEEARRLVERLDRTAFRDLRFRGRAARRAVRQYGLEYDYASGAVAPTEPLPGWLAPLRERAAALAGVPADALVQTLVTRYPAGAAIGWHRDAPAFGIVVGVSLGSACRLRLRPGPGGPVYVAALPPRSGYVLAGPARDAFEHAVAPVPALRYSVTLRTLAGAAG